MTWSFVSHTQATLFGGGSPALALANPIAADLSDMRPSLLPGLVAAAQRNADRGSGDLALFEVGQVFRGDGEGDQRLAAAVVRRGTAGPGGSGRDWQGDAAPVGVFEAKADAVALLGALGVPLAGLQIVQGAPAPFHPGRSGRLQLGPKTEIGVFGELNPKVLDQLGAGGPIAVVEIILDALPPPKARPTRARPKLQVSDLMPVDRDFAFVVESGVSAAEILRAVQAADRTLIVAATVFDRYTGPGLPEGTMSVGVAVTLQPREHTLTDAELEAVSAAIEREVARKTGAVLRR